MAMSPKCILEKACSDFHEEVDRYVKEGERQLLLYFPTYKVVKIGSRSIGASFTGGVHPLNKKTMLECVLMNFKTAGWKIKCIKEATATSEAVYEFKE